MGALLDSLKRGAGLIGSTPAPSAPRGVPPLDPSSEEARSGVTDPMYVYGNPPGLIKPGNIDLRKLLPVADPSQPGRWGTVYSSNNEIGGKETVYPGIINGGFRSDQEAIKNAMISGRNLGQFSNPDDATNYAITLHKDWENPGIMGLSSSHSRVVGAPYPSSQYSPLVRKR